MTSVHAVGTINCLEFEEGVPVWAGVNDVVDPRKRDTHAPRLDLQEEDTGCVDEGLDNVDDVVGNKRSLVDDILDLGRRGRIAVALHSCPFGRCSLAVQDLSVDLGLCQSLLEQLQLGLEVRHDHRGLALLEISLHHVHDVAELCDFGRVPLAHILRVPENSRHLGTPDLLGIQNNLRVDGCLALTQDHRELHHAPNMAGKPASVGSDPGVGVLDASGDVVVEPHLLGRLKVVDVLVTLELGTAHHHFGAELAVAVLLELLGRETGLEELGVGTDIGLGVVEGCGGQAPARPGRDLTQSPEDGSEVADDMDLVHHHPIKGLFTEPPNVLLQNGMVRGYNGSRASRGEMSLVLDVLDAVEGEVGLAAEFGEPAADSRLGSEDEGAGQQVVSDERRSNAGLAETHVQAEEPSRDDMIRFADFHPIECVSLVGIHSVEQSWISSTQTDPFSSRFVTMVDSEVNLAIASLTFSVLSFLVMVIGLVLVFYPGLRESLTGATSGMASTGSGILDNLKIAGVLGGALSPDIVLLIGFISDLMNLKFRFSVTSIIGIIAVILHWVIGGSIFGFSKGVTSAVASTASAITAAVAPKAPTAPSSSSSSQIFGVGDGNPTAPTATPPAAAAAAVAAVAAPASPAGVLGAIAKPQRQAASRKLTMPTGNKPPRRPGSVSTAPDMGESAAAAPAGPTSRSVSFATRPQRKTAAAATEANQKLAANKMTGGAALPDYITQKFNPCAIRGLGYFDISGSPMGMAALSAVFMVYLLDMTVGSKRSSAQAGGFAGFSAAIFLLNVYAYRELKCVDTTTVTASLKAVILPLAVGLLSGTGGYYVLKNNYADFLPLDGTHFDDGTETTPSPANRNQAHCQAPNDQGEMVCEAYRDGKRVNA